VSRYYTNVHIFEPYDSYITQSESIKRKDFEIELLQAKINNLQAVLENIPNAVVEYGYVDITYEKTKKIRLVAAASVVEEE
jgi:hypothetical protein